MRAWNMKIINKRFIILLYTLNCKYIYNKKNLLQFIRSWWIFYYLVVEKKRYIRSSLFQLYSNLKRNKLTTACRLKKICLNCVIGPNFRFGPMASLKTFYRGKEPNRPVAQFSIGCRGIFRSDSVGWSVGWRVGQMSVGPLPCLPQNKSGNRLTV